MGKGGKGQNHMFRGRRPSAPVLLRAAWPPCSLIVVTWAEKQSPDSGRMPVMGGPDCHPTTRRVRDAALFCKLGRNRSMKPLEPELSLMDFCPLSPATTVSTLSSSGMFFQQPKIVSKNVSQKKGQGYTVLAHPFCEAKMRTLIFISDIFYYCFKGRE